MNPAAATVASVPAKALEVTRGGTRVPSLLWRPADGCAGLIVACHGGSGHKASPAILNIVAAAAPHRLAVVAIDGPVHGERRSDGSLDPGVARQAFRQAWAAGVGAGTMAADMTAALDAALATIGSPGLPVGYVGVSMGTAYGLELLGSEPRMRAAVIGLWGANHVNSGPLLDQACRVRCPVWFVQQWHDEIFDRDGTAALFDAIASVDKRRVVYPGPHRELEGERLDDAMRFVAGRLAAG